MSELDLVNEQLKMNNEQHGNLERRKREIERQERKIKFEHYYDNVDLSEADKFVSDIMNVLSENDRYCFADIELNIWSGYKLYVYDKQLKKKVKVITIKDGNLQSRNLEEDEIKL